MMTKPAKFSCDYCGERHYFPISAALCCDPISNDLIDEDDLPPFTD